MARAVVGSICVGATSNGSSLGYFAYRVLRQKGRVVTKETHLGVATITAL